MSKIRQAMLKMCGLLSACALAVGVLSVTSTSCAIWFHQPKVPEKMRETK